MSVSMSTCKVQFDSFPQTACSLRLAEKLQKVRGRGGCGDDGGRGSYEVGIRAGERGD